MCVSAHQHTLPSSPHPPCLPTFCPVQVFLSKISKSPLKDMEAMMPVLPLQTNVEGGPVHP